MSNEKNKKKKYYPKKEHASRKTPRPPKKSMSQKLKELQEHFNDNYHAP